MRQPPFCPSSGRSLAQLGRFYGWTRSLVSSRRAGLSQATLESTEPRSLPGLLCFRELS